VTRTLGQDRQDCGPDVASAHPGPAPVAFPAPAEVALPASASPAATASAAASVFAICVLVLSHVELLPKNTLEVSRYIVTDHDTN
jgi:hypothetical protein